MFIQRTDIPPRAFSTVENITNDLTKLRLVKEAREQREMLMAVYGDLLDQEGRMRADSIEYGYKTAEKYAEGFLCNVLMQSYRVFDKSHRKYLPLLKRVREHNPEWERALIADHERKLRVCKVHIYVGTQ